MNPNKLGREIQGGSAETKQQQRKRSDRLAARLYRGRHEAEKIREERELQQQIGDDYEQARALRRMGESARQSNADYRG